MSFRLLRRVRGLEHRVIKKKQDTSNIKITDNHPSKKARSSKYSSTILQVLANYKVNIIDSQHK